MKKELIVVSLICMNAYGFNAHDYNASGVENKDLKELKKFEKTIYDLTLESNNFDISKIFRFINSNKSRIEVTTRWTIKFDNKLGLRKGRDQTGATREYASSMLNINYPILDKKEDKQIFEAKLKIKQEVLSLIREYGEVKGIVEHIKLKIKYLRLKEMRDKVRVKEGVGSFNERLAIIESILENNKELTTNEVKLMELEETLKLEVKKSKRKELTKLLRS